MTIETARITDPDEGFTVGDWAVDPSANELSRDGETTKLEPKVMRVLCVLAAQPGNVISREELESRAWAGMVVGYDAVSNTIIKLRKAFGDDSRDPRYIETISKGGYRLIAPVATRPLAVADTNTGSLATTPVVLANGPDPTSVYVVVADWGGARRSDSRRIRV